MDVFIILAIFGSILGKTNAQWLTFEQVEEMLANEKSLNAQLKDKLLQLQLKAASTRQENELVKTLNGTLEMLKDKKCEKSCDKSVADLQNRKIKLQTTVDVYKSIYDKNQELIMGSIEKQLQMCRDQLTRSIVRTTVATTVTQEMEEPTSCAAFNFFSGIRVIYLPDGRPLHVLCDSYTAGPGWTVIQRRMDGSVDFYRNWSDYREGFGQLQGEFFIGLQNLHQLTNYQRYELYVQVESFNGTIERAWYDDFVVGSEAESYKLKSVGQWTGTSNRMTQHVNVTFSTYDRENSPNCYSEKYYGGWWYYDGLSDGSNLNGKYLKNEMYDVQGIHWVYFDTNKDVKMLIRPYK